MNDTQSVDAVSLIKESLNEDSVIEILESYGISPTSTSGNILRMACPIHNGNNGSSFVYNLENHLYYCQSCGTYGDVIALVENLANVKFVSAVNIIASFVGINLNGLTIKKRSNKLEQDMKQWLKYCQSKQRKVNTYVMPDVALKNLSTFRSFKKETIIHFGLKYAPSFPVTNKSNQVSSVRNKLVAPITFYNEQVGVALRRTNEQDMPKWLFQPVKLDKRHLLYNLEKKAYDEIILCEGMFDVWAYHEIDIPYSCAVLGLNITKEQKNILIKHTNRITLSLDADKYGLLGTQKCIDELKSSFDLAVVDFKYGDDPASIDREELKEAYKNKLHWKDWVNKHGEA